MPAAGLGGILPELELDPDRRGQTQQASPATVGLAEGPVKRNVPVGRLSLELW